MVDQNVLTAYPAEQISDNGCDFTSIMCYQVAQGEANVVVGRNNAFSPIDDARIKMDYGKAIEPPPPPPDPTTVALISQGKPCSQSSSYSSAYPASSAVDGLSTTFQHSGDEQKPWWEVDLGAKYDISSIEVLNRQGCCQYRTRKFKIFVTDTPVKSYDGTPVYTHVKTSGFNVLTLEKLKVSGRYVRIWVDNGMVPNWMHLAEVKVWGAKSASQQPKKKANK
jgi:hypothetical protein